MCGTHGDDVWLQTRPPEIGGRLARRGPGAGAGAALPLNPTDLLPEGSAVLPILPETPRSFLRLLGLGAVGLAGVAGVHSWEIPDPGTEYVGVFTPHEAQTVAIRDGPLAETELGARWLEAAERAFVEPLPVSYGHVEKGRFLRAGPEALGFRVSLPPGQRLEVEVRGPLWQRGELFLDLFRLPPEKAAEAHPVQLQARAGGSGRITWEFEAEEELLVRLQPAFLSEGDYELRLRRVSALAFPVAGHDQGSMLSPFGAPREGGRRRHHGIDILAPRGTPVLAAAEGRVRRVRETPVGGRVVWIRDEARGSSLYYAHLDRQLVRAGQRVQAGDTVGLVGNTGNARTTPPHLHFGIYRRGRGPIDPLPYVRVLPSIEAELAVESEVLGAWVAARSPQVRVRAAPSLEAAVVATLEEEETVRVAAVTGRAWYRVRLRDGRTGFLARRVAEPAPTLTQP